MNSTSELEIAFLLLMLPIGFMLGSFISVLACRHLKDWRSILFGRSLCPHCSKQLAWFELIPLFSWLIQKGFCRGCRAKISIKYPLLELVTALLFVLLFYRFGASWLFIGHVLLAIVLLTIFIRDLETMIISDLLMIALILPLAIIIINEPMIPERIIGVALFTLVIGALVVPSRGRWMGWADLKLAPFLGATLGLTASIIALYSAFVIGGLYASSLLITKRVKPKTEVPFAPFLIIGFYIALFWQEQIVILWRDLLF